MGVNPVKRTRYKIIEGDLEVVGPDAIAAIQIPNVTIETAEHVEANHRRKTPTIINVEDFTIKLFEDQEQRNDWWLTKLPYDQDTGAFLDPVNTEFSITIQQLAYDGVTTIREWEVKQCLAIGSSFEESERTSADNQIRTITLSPTRMTETTL